MKKKKNIVVKVEKTDTGFSAFAEDQAIYTTARSVPELINNAYEACDLYFDDESSKEISFEIDFQQFFKYYKVINAKFLAEKIGMNASLLSQYIRGHKKPSKKQSVKILEGIHQIGEELSSISLLRSFNED